VRVSEGGGGALATTTAIPTRISEPKEDVTTFLCPDDNCDDPHCASLNEVAHANTNHSSDHSIIVDPLAPNTTALAERESVTRDAYRMTLKFATPGEPRLLVSESHSTDEKDTHHDWGIIVGLSPKDLASCSSAIRRLPHGMVGICTQIDRAV